MAAEDANEASGHDAEMVELVVGRAQLYVDDQNNSVGAVQVDISLNPPHGR